MSKESEMPSSFIAPSVEELSPLFPAYGIEGFIAQGGMGAVYKANQKSLDRPVAIKILPREFGDDAQFRASFEAEAKAMARLNHPNLIRVYDFGDVDGMLFIIMEYVQGKALFYSIHNKAIDPTIAINLICKVSRGLAHAHKSGILHRDIKPANILLDIDAEPKVGDFGLARPVNAKRGEGLALGTPGYTAPEVFNHKYDIDQRSDIFSVGAMLFELIKGRAPESNSTNMKTGLDARLDAILSKATHPDPNQRHKDVDQLADQLELLAQKLSGPRFTAAERSTSAPPATITQLKSSKSSPIPTLIVIALLLGGGAFALFRGQQEDEPEIITSKTPEKPIVDKKSSKPKKDPKKDHRKPKVAKNNPKPSPKPKPDPNPDPDPVVTREKPLDSLLRLQGALAKGKLGELPVGAIKRGDSAFFLYRPSKTWPEAQALAENFGASLASAKNKDDLRFFRDSFKSEKTVWLGASDSGVEGKWYWMDGEPVSKFFWAKASPDNDPEAARFGEDFAGLTSNGIEDFSGIGKCPAIFEWTLTQPNPGSLDAQLARTAASLAAKSPPIFPASAFEFNRSRYLLLKRELNYEDASQIATQAGGHLAVTSSQEEANHFVSLMNATLKEDESCWFGGRRSEEDPEVWETPTAEAFAFHKWLPNNPDYSHGKESALEYVHSGEKGFNDRVPEDAISYTLIEWSHPDLRNMSPVAADLTPILEKIEVIRTAIRDRHSRDYERYRRKKDKIISDWVKNSIKRIELDRTFPDALKAPVIATLKGYDEKHELPKDLPPGAPRKIKRTFKDAKADILELWEEYEEEYEEAKADYIQELTRAMKTALSLGDATFAKFCQKEIDALEEKGPFGKILAEKDVVALPE